MSGRGRPLRFLVAIGIGWAGMRVAVLWPAAGSLPEAIRLLLPLTPARAGTEYAAPAEAAHAAATPRPAISVSPGMVPVPPTPAPRARDPVRVQFALLGLVQYGEAQTLPAHPQPAAALPWAMPAARLPDASRWSGSGWFVARAGTGLGGAPGANQLGGGQAGVRLAWALTRDRRVALAGRLSAPLSGPGREAAFGIEWQPFVRTPLRLIAGQRFGLDGTRGGPEIGLVAGLDRRIASFRLEGYGQTGAVLRTRAEPYVDGAMRLTHPVARQGALRLDLGIGAWGAAQRDAARLDMGPSLGLTLPVAGKQWRVALDWRQRVAGNARPGSGAALTLGTDF